MKYLFIFLLLIMPISYAATDLKVIEIDGFVEDERESGVDEDGGEFDVKADDILELVIRIENDRNETVEARIRGTLENIDDGDDIIKCQPNCDSDGDWDSNDWYDINADDDKSKTLSFVIPLDVRSDDYDLEIEVFSRFNNTEDDLDRIDFRVNAEKDGKKVSEVDIPGLLSNLTSSCNLIADTTNACFGFIGGFNNCSAELSTVKEERGTFKQTSEDLTGTVESLKSEKAKLEREKTALTNQVNERITRIECNNLTATACLFFS